MTNSIDTGHFLFRCPASHTFPAIVRFLVTLQPYAMCAMGRTPLDSCEALPKSHQGRSRIAQDFSPGETAVPLGKSRIHDVGARCQALFRTFKLLPSGVSPLSGGD